jgi:DNA-binding SARP family transcriptional activator
MGGAMMAGDAVAFGLLGPLLVMDSGGSPVHISAAKQRIILAALLLQSNRIVTVEGLADAVWDCRPPPTASAAIRTYIMRLRRALGPVGARLIRRPSGYVIEIRHPAELDLAELERLRSEVQEAARPGQWSRVAALCTRALNLWRGNPLEDIPSAVLSRPEVERLMELRLEFTEARIDAELRLGRDNLLVPELRRLADQHPFREHFHAQLMLAYYRRGRQAEALEVYQHVRATLVRELGIEPGPELRQMHRLILEGDPGLTAGTCVSRILAFDGQAGQ